MESLDPRFKRLHLITEAPAEKKPLDQLPTYEVFVQVKEPRAYKHEGCVHSNSLPMALIFAKEQFSRRGMCAGIWVVDTRDVLVTDYTDNETDIYSQIEGIADESGEEFAIFHMIKRGTQHSFAGNVKASSPETALKVAKEAFERKKPVLNAWVVPVNKMLKTAIEDREMWETTPKKLFREAIDYKTQEKLKEFKSRQS
jgi:ring-1,2-phenylacetyl-CoA epoxidase subunit PaaB